MTRKDTPYVATIIIFMVTMFFAGRLSVSGQPMQAPVPVTSVSAAISTPAPVAEPGLEHDGPRDVQSLPTVVTVETLPEKSLAKAASKPVEVKPVTTMPSVIAPVPPMQIELEDDPVAVANPYKPKPVASSPGF